MFYYIIKLCAFIAYFSIHLPCALTQQCGQDIYDSRLGRIVGGHPVGYYKYPWFAILEDRLSSSSNRLVSCGGSLISDVHVLTAAHCFPDKNKKYNVKRYNVVLGVYNNCKDENSRVIYEVQDVIVHEEYGDENAWHDIALVTLKNKAPNDVVCLPSGPELPDMGTVTGFGVQRSGLSVEPCEQQEVDVRIYDQATCRKMLQYQEQSSDPEQTIPVNAFCAGYLEGGKDSCQGDSGGPLSAKDESGIRALLGIVSFGYGCAEPYALGVYTKVFHYLDWISNNTDGYIETPTRKAETVTSPTHRPKKHKKPFRKPHPRPVRYSVWDTVNYYSNLKRKNPNEENKTARKG